MFGFQVTPLDSLRTQVIDREDPKEKIVGTIFQSMRPTDPKTA